MIFINKIDNASKQVKLNILSDFSGHITGNKGLPSEVANNLYKELKYNSIITNKKKWICEQFYSLYKNRETNIALKYDEDENDFGDSVVYENNPNLFIVTHKGTKKLANLINCIYHLKKDVRKI